MKKISHVIVGAMCLISSAGAFAHAYKGEAGYKGETLIPVTVPNFQGGFEFGISALYLRPSSSNLDYVGVSRELPEINSFDKTNFHQRNISPDYHWGFLLQLGYVFPNTGNDVRINWTRLHDNGDTNSSAVHGSAVDSVDVETIFGEFLGLDDGDVLHAKGEATYQFDAVDFDFGQFINIGNSLQTRLFAGLRWARLNNDLSYAYHGTAFLDELLVSTHTFHASAESDSSFNGVGPLFGVSANYEVGYGFGVSGTLDAALLVGNLDLSQSDHSLEVLTSNGSITNESVENFNDGSENVIAPAFDAKLGVNYNYAMSNGMQFMLELGYQVSKYFDVIETGSYDVEFHQAPTETSNFGLNGPYLTLNVKI